MIVQRGTTNGFRFSGRVMFSGMFDGIVPNDGRYDAYASVHAARFNARQKETFGFWRVKVWKVL